MNDEPTGMGASITDLISNAVSELEDWETRLTVDAGNVEEMLSEAHYMLASARRLIEVATRVENKIGPDPVQHIPEHVRRGDALWPRISSRAERFFPHRDAAKWD